MYISTHATNSYQYNSMRSPYASKRHPRKVECRPCLNPNMRLAMHPNHTKRLFHAGTATHAGASLPSLPLTVLCCGGGGGNSKRVFSAIIRWKPIPTPSMTASSIAHPIAPFRIARGPPRTARAPPVKKPAMMAFQGSSLRRTPLTAQSKVLNMPPQTPKLPPRTGARALTAVIAGVRRWC